MNQQIIVPPKLELFLKQENRFFINAQGTKTNRFLLKVYLESLINHPSEDPFEQLLIQTHKTKKAQTTQDPILNRLLKKIAHEQSPNQPLPLLNEFEEIALEGDYRRLEERADMLVSYPIDEVRDPLTLMLGNKLQTRKGMSIDPSEPFLAADPVAIKHMIAQHAKKTHYNQIQSWIRDCSGRAIDYFKERETRNESA